MLKTLKLMRGAVSLLNPSQAQKMAAKAPEIGLIASTSIDYAAMEDFLIPAAVPHEERLTLMRMVHRASDAGAPDNLDLVLYHAGSGPCPAGCFLFAPEDPGQTVRQIVEARDDIGLALARHYLPFRKPVVDACIQAVCRENAMFALATALPNVIPSLIELPWAMGEFASDTAFLTLNQVRMAFLIAAAVGRPVGLSEQKFEIGSIVAGAFGWRAIARELAGKIPLGGGLIPKGAIAYAGTYVVGKGIERLYRVGGQLSRAERRQLYSDGLAKGRLLVQAAEARPPAG